MNNDQTEPTIVTNWDSMPPEVYANGEMFSTRVLCKQHQDAEKKVKALEAELFSLYHKEASGQGSDNDRARAYAIDRVNKICKNV